MAVQFSLEVSDFTEIMAGEINFANKLRSHDKWCMGSFHKMGTHGRNWSCHFTL